MLQGLGEFILTHPDIRMPDRGKIYSFNEGNAMYFHEPVIKYLESIKCRSLIFLVPVLTFTNPRLASCRPKERQALQRQIHWFHGGRHSPHSVVRWYLRVREKSDSQLELGSGD